MPRSPRCGGSSMPADRTTAIDAQASDWLIRQRDPAFADWDAFADWLAEDPAHGDTYDAIASLDVDLAALPRSEEHTSELQSLMRISYAVFCLKQKININIKYIIHILLRLITTVQPH